MGTALLLDPAGVECSKHTAHMALALLPTRNLVRAICCLLTQMLWSPQAMKYTFQHTHAHPVVMLMSSGDTAALYWNVGRSDHERGHGAGARRVSAATPPPAQRAD